MKTQLTVSIPDKRILTEFFNTRFTNPDDPRTYEEQRNDFLEAARMLAVCAFMSIGFDKDKATKIVEHYENMYSKLSDFEEPNSEIVRAYHILSHPLVQMFSELAADLLLLVHKKLKTEKPEDVFRFAKFELEQNPALAMEVRNKLRHDVVQANGTKWQKGAMELLENDKWTLKDLVEGKPKGTYPPELVACGFDGSLRMQEFITLAARQFFPTTNGKYSKDKLMKQIGCGTAEFLSAVNCFYIESDHGKNPNIPDMAETIAMNIFIAGTIPFGPANSFDKMLADHLAMLKPKEKYNILVSLSHDYEFQAECKKYKVSNEDQLEYWLTKKVSEACHGANCDVINFGSKDPKAVYYGDLSFKTETIRKGRYVLDIQPLEERAQYIIDMIKDHEPGGFVREKGEAGVIYHGFTNAKWPHLNVMDPKLVKEAHDQYLKNTETVIRAHKINLIQTALEFIYRKEIEQGKAIGKIDAKNIKPEAIDEIAKMAREFFTGTVFDPNTNTKIPKYNDPVSQIFMGLKILSKCPLIQEHGPHLPTKPSSSLTEPQEMPNWFDFARQNLPKAVSVRG